MSVLNNTIIMLGRQRIYSKAAGTEAAKIMMVGMVLDLGAERDWRHVKDDVQGMWLMLQQDELSRESLC